MGSRTWVKIYCGNWIEGSLRQEKPALRGVWADLLALCGGGQYSQEGEIKVRKDIGYTDSMLSKVLNISPKVWAASKKRLVETDRLEVKTDNILAIINWKNYQSEYERQKPLRTKSADESATESAGIEVEVDYRSRSRSREKREKFSTAQQYLFNILLECPAIKKSDAYKLPDLMEDYPNLNYKLEFKKFVEWWPGEKKHSRPWATLRNWLGRIQPDDTKLTDSGRYPKL